jgi:uncharacterized DUF497 family protein
VHFDWDAGKANSNEHKHGVTFEEASTLFEDPFYLVFADPDHSDDEERFIIVGESTEHRLLVVSYSESLDTVRLISARAATRSERESYEKDI